MSPEVYSEDSKKADLLEVRGVVELSLAAPGLFTTPRPTEVLRMRSINS